MILGPVYCDLPLLRYPAVAMTYQQITWAINDAAILPAESAFDAFGSDPNATLPPLEVAWEFLNESVYGEDEVETPGRAPRLLDPPVQARLQPAPAMAGRRARGQTGLVILLS